MQGTGYRMQDQGRLQLPALLQVSEYCESDLEHEHSTKLSTSPFVLALLQVFEYCESDLEQLIKDRRTLLSAADIKAYMHMILAALHFCHRNWVLHRDIKPNNFLITKQGALTRPCVMFSNQGLSSPGRTFSVGQSSQCGMLFGGLVVLGRCHRVSVTWIFKTEQIRVGAVLQVFHCQGLQTRGTAAEAAQVMHHSCGLHHLLWPLASVMHTGLPRGYLQTRSPDSVGARPEMASTS